MYIFQRRINNIVLILLTNTILNLKSLSLSEHLKINAFLHEKHLILFIQQTTNFSIICKYL